jgi:hypothetical protein
MEGKGAQGLDASPGHCVRLPMNDKMKKIKTLGCLKPL